MSNNKTKIKKSKNNCPKCNGKGQILEFYNERCSVCGGGGVTYYAASTQVCRNCSGKGLIAMERYVPCDYCFGKGTINY